MSKGLPDTDYRENGWFITFLSKLSIRWKPPIAISSHVVHTALLWFINGFAGLVSRLWIGLGIGLFWFGLVCFGLVCFVLVWFGLSAIYQQCARVLLTYDVT